METSLTYLGTVLECKLQSSFQATLEAYFSLFFKIKYQDISPICKYSGSFYTKD